MIERLFVGRHQPTLVAAVQVLRERYQRGDVWDLAPVLLVVPGRQAGRRLRQIMDEAAARAGVTLAGLCDPVTPAELLERLHRPDRPLASPTQARFAWREAAHRLPTDGARPPLASLAAEAPRLRETLAAERVSFSDLAGAGDNARWGTLARLEHVYQDVLAGAGLSDRDDARLAALARGDVACDQTIFLVGVQDLNGMERAMLTALTTPVCAVIPATDDEWGGFDEVGSLRVEFWHDRPLPIPDECLKFVEGPAEEASTLAAQIRTLTGEFGGEGITVGVGDESGADALARRLAVSGLPTKSPFGRPLGRLGPAALLRMVRDYLQDGPARRFAALIRHPDLEQWLAALSQDDVHGWPEAAQAMADAPLIHCLDVYRAECLVEHFPPTEWAVPMTALDAARRRVLAARDRMENLVAPLRGGPSPLPDWMGPITFLLRTVFGDVPQRDGTAESRLARRGRARLAEVLHDLRRLPNPLAPATTGTEALTVVCAEADGILLPSDPDGPALATMGWLELALDDAPALLLTGLHEGGVPANAGNDALLPDSVRRRWGLADDRRRQARDAWLLRVMLDTRKQVRIVVTRRGSDGAPRMPSRLLFACDGPTAARRTLAFTKPADQPHPTPPLFIPGIARRLPPPPPELLATEITSLKVTAFRDYLACPYRFYLRHVMRLDECGDDADEMDPRAFGNLLHPALEDFARSSAADSTDPARIAAFLRDALERQARRRFGPDRPPSVRFQAHQARKRLDAFAHWQARSARDGWQIQNDLAERELEAALDVDGRPFVIRGRLDRVDYHPATDRFRIIDYKTGDAGSAPEDKHRTSAEDGGRAWVELQLPLYRTLLAAQGFSVDAIEVGYVLLASDLNPVSVSASGRASGGAGYVGVRWGEDDYRSAHECAAGVVRQIRAGVFWPPSPPPRYTDALSSVCLDTCGDREEWFASQEERTP